MADGACVAYQYHWESGLILIRHIGSICLNILYTEQNYFIIYSASLGMLPTACHSALVS